jgi:PAS domain S-box-containing protein
LSRESLSWSDRCKAIFGLSPDDEITPERFEVLIHPDDREWLLQNVRDSIANGTDHSVEYRVVRGDGVNVWVAATGRVRYDAVGSPIRFEGIAQDITDRKRLEEEVEAGRLSALERERHITASLQAAAQPDLPRVAPGLDLAFFFKAALGEADIGGDFADVYPVSSGCTALIVGDLSGKGLAAAAQVFTVRHALRAFLFTEPSLVRAVSQLNSFVVQGDLLPGFVTLFAAAFDPSNNLLSYVSCGHEPGLIRRADTGLVEALPPTGPILGVDEAAVFMEETVALKPGDALLLYTDGLTEVGTSFRDFLGVDGMTRLLAESRATESVGLMSGVVSGVQEHAKGVLRDDACLLAAVVL